MRVRSLHKRTFILLIIIIPNYASLYTIKGKHIVGHVEEKSKARKAYAEAVSQGHGAYLLEEGKRIEKRTEKRTEKRKKREGSRGESDNSFGVSALSVNGMSGRL